MFILNSMLVIWWTHLQTPKNFNTIDTTCLHNLPTYWRKIKAMLHDLEYHDVKQKQVHENNNLKPHGQSIIVECSDNTIPSGSYNH